MHMQIIKNFADETTLDNFFKRDDTLSVGIYNGCQLFMELEKINAEHQVHAKLLHNDSKKHESIFTLISIPEHKMVMLSSLGLSAFLVLVSRDETKFTLQEPK